MADYGFWNLAQQDPAHLALVTPDDERLSAGELLARANRVVHGLRALGLGTGDVVTTVLPNGAPMIELYLACAQAGLYLVPINHHLTGPDRPINQVPPSLMGPGNAQVRRPYPQFSNVSVLNPPLGNLHRTQHRV